ncbi:hypothetical protein RHGRI_035618 [Rhododendron griersonianum]|uniref:Uncharacterized protein n=1 Tax=Rhododendron griersonianum TaxID=479676 RepID=A0AAV6HP02_9ERIC|nr:hypothetical protein RHGRI_035618 [Rhododendron griersonianum]
MSKPKAEWVRKEPVVAPDVCSLPMEETLGPQGPSEMRETVVISEKSKSKQGEVCQTGIEAVHYSTPVKLASKILSQSPIMRSDNSFSALALFEDKAGEVEIDKTGAVLTKEEILSLETVPTVEPDIVVFSATKRGRGKNKGGLNNPLKQKEVYSMIKLHKLGMVGVIEAKIRPENIDSTVKRCFPAHWLSVHNASLGSVARIVLGWDPQLLTVDVVHSSSQLLVAKVLTGDYRCFYVSVVYGHNSLVTPRELWMEMRFLYASIGDVPWIQLELLKRRIG